MVATPETQPSQTEVPEGVVERPVEMAKVVEAQSGVSVIPAQYQSGASDNQARPQMQVVPAPKQIVIQTPADDNQLTNWSKGPAENSITWFAVFWLRLIKKAMHFGWKTVTKPVAT